MEEQITRLVDKTWAKYKTLSPQKRLLIAISGIPGSGKTTLASTVVNRLNAIHAEQHQDEPPVATFVPMDGYHLSRAVLSAMPDPAHAHARRGASFTFDAPSFHSLLESIRFPLDSKSQVLYAPSFDHALKDPVENDIPIYPTSRIVVFEGNYLSLDVDPWNKAASLMDELWFVECDFETARKRLVPRHVKAGIAKDEEEAEWRVRENDLVNGREIVERRVKDIDEVVVSMEDDKCRPDLRGD